MNVQASNLVQKPLLSDVKIVDADTHVSEWPDLWTARAPAKYKDRVPQLREFDGKRVWVIDGDKRLGSTSPNCAIRNDGSKAVGMEFVNWTFDEVHPGSHNVEARLNYMDSIGVAAQIAYPNVLGFGGQRAMNVDADLRRVSVEIYNDAMADLQQRSGNRIFPMGLMPWWDIKLAVKEAERCNDMGLRGINTNSDPHVHGLPDLGNDYWAPLWDLCADRGMPVNFHIGASDESSSWFGSGVWPQFKDDLNAQLAYGSTMMFLSNSRVLANIILSGFLERFPKLNIVSVESGVGWIPFLLEALKYQMDETNIRHSLTPHEIFQRQIYACSWFEKANFVASARELGVDNVLFETDFPHPTCLYPDADSHITEAASGFTSEERGKIFGGNATRIYNLPI